MSVDLDSNSVTRQLCDFARANFVPDGAAFDENSPLGEVGIDSFALFELLLYGERTFGVRVPPSHLTRENLASIATLAGCISRLAGNARAAS